MQKLLKCIHSYCSSFFLLSFSALNVYAFLEMCSIECRLLPGIVFMHISRATFTSRSRVCLVHVHLHRLWCCSMRINHIIVIFMHLTIHFPAHSISNIRKWKWFSRNERKLICLHLCKESTCWRSGNYFPSTTHSQTSSNSIYMSRSLCTLLVAIAVPLPSPVNTIPWIIFIYVCLDHTSLALTSSRLLGTILNSFHSKQKQAEILAILRLAWAAVCWQKNRITRLYIKPMWHHNKQKYDD